LKRPFEGGGQSVPTAQLIVRIIELILFGALAAASLVRWRRRRDRAGVWAAGTFGVVALVVVAAFLIDPNSESDAASWARKFLVAVLLLFPYLLFRYASEFGVMPRIRRLGEAATGAVIVWTLLLGKVHGQKAPRTTALEIFVFAVLLQWTLLSAAAARILWHAGAGQATVARRRMRTLAAATVLLNLALVVGAYGKSDTHAVMPVVTGIVVITSGILFYTGFVPPRWLRTLWRTADSATLRAAEISLMTVVDPADIGAALLPGVTKLFGGKGSVLVDAAGDVLATSGLSPAEAKATAMVAVNAHADAVLESGMVAVPMRNGWLAVRGSVATPFFSNEEIEILRALGAFADLALDRAELFSRERSAREAAERANNELETFVYSVSHDLKSPLVSLLGFLDYLKSDVEGSLSTDGEFFLRRISASAMYMQALIQDLLELSRIGRVQTEAADVDLQAVVDEVQADIAAVHPEAVFHVDALPAVSMNPLRARQLFTNLVNNALVHGGRDDIVITIDSTQTPDGDVLVRVADNGKGIPVDYRDRVFGVFERLERQDDATGTGIGLAVCRKIVEQCGGDIAISDSEPGACFSIHLPAAMVRQGPKRLEAAK
jgi:signal transduction histidine kinase